MTQYLGYDVLEAVADGRVSRVDSYERGMVSVGSPFGRLDVDDTEGVSEVVRAYAWTCIGLSEVAVLKAFVDARRGRQIPFWLPSLEHDLQLNGDHNSGHTFLDVVAVGYTEELWPYSGARRHLCIRNMLSGAVVYRKVTSSVNNLNGTESLYLDSPLGVDVPVAGWQVSFLRLCRMDEDGIDLSFDARDYAAATLRFRELPHEAPL